MARSNTKKGQNEAIDLFENSNNDNDPQRLQKQLRQMEKEKLIFLEEKTNKLNKKEKIINLLKFERNALKEELNDIQLGPHAKKISIKELEMEKLLIKKSEYYKKIEEQKTNLWELEGHIKKLTKKLKTIHENHVKLNKNKKQSESFENEKLMLENQLDVVNKRCGEVMSENSNLRLLIDHMLIERSHFNDMWEKMVIKLENGKKYILELTEQSISAYDQREELCNKIQNLKEKSLNESTIHIQEIRELQRKLDHDAKLQEFFEIKTQQRTNVDLEIREANKKIQIQKDLENQLEDYSRILNAIKELCDEKSVENLGKHFSKQEEENFALFNYVNELSHEVEMLNVIVQDLEDEAENQRGKTENKDQNQVITIETLQNDLDIVLRKSKDVQMIQLAIENQLVQLLNGIAKLFRLIRCAAGGGGFVDDSASPPILEMLGDHKLITIFNFKLFLGIIKLRTNAIINSITFVDQPSKILAKKDRIPKFNVKTNIIK